MENHQNQLRFPVNTGEGQHTIEGQGLARHGGSPRSAKRRESAAAVEKFRTLFECWECHHQVPEQWPRRLTMTPVILRLQLLIGLALQTSEIRSLLFSLVLFALFVPASDRFAISSRFD